MTVSTTQKPSDAMKDGASRETLNDMQQEDRSNRAKRAERGRHGDPKDAGKLAEG